MNKLTRIEGGIACLLVALTLLVGASSCVTDTSDNPPPPVTQTNTVARPWAPGITLTFPQSPSDNCVTLMRLAHARATATNTVWIIERYDRLDRMQNAAFEAALRENAVLKGWRP